MTTPDHHPLRLTPLPADEWGERARTAARVAGWCDRPSRPGWMRAFGQRLLTPGESPSCHSDPLSGSACGSGCSGCASGESASAAPAEQPIHFVRRK